MADDPGTAGGTSTPLDLAATEPTPTAKKVKPEPGPTFNPEPQRERVRGYLALGLVILLALITGASFTLLATNVLTLPESQGLLTAVFTPLLALTGTALGFYFGGGQQRQ